MSNFESLLFYIFVFCLATFFMFLSQHLKSRKNGQYIYFLCLAFIIPLIVSGLRYEVGTDYLGYIRRYYATFQMSFIEYIRLGEYEVGFFALQKISTWFNDFQVLFLISSFIILIFIFLAILKLGNKISMSLCLLIFLFIFFPITFNVMRQGVALAIVVFAYKYIFEGNFKKYLIFCLIASIFHITALIVIPFFFLFNFSKKVENFKNREGILRRSGAIILGVIFVLNFGFFIDLLSNISIFEKFDRYAIENDRGENREIYLKALILLIIIILKDKLIAYDHRNKLYIYFLIIDLVITFVGFENSFIKRLGIYFSISQIFILPSILQILGTKLDRYIVRCLIIFYAIGYFILVYYILNQGGVVPYKMNLFEINGI